MGASLNRLRTWNGRLVGLLGLTFGLALLGGATPFVRADEAKPVAAAPGSTEYIIGVDDEIVIFAAGHTEISQAVRVLADGKLYPGGVKEPIKASGMTLTQLKGELEKGFKRLYNNVELSVSIKESLAYRVTIIGGRTSGQFGLRKDMRVSTLFALAGGAPAKTKLLIGTLIRGAQRTTLEMQKIAGSKPDPDADLLLQAGDTVIVDVKEDAPPPSFQVIGAVMRPGSYDMPLDGTPVPITKAIGMAQGKSEKAALSKATLLRKGKTIPLNLYPLLVQGRVDTPEAQIIIEDGDTILIPETLQKFSVIGAVQRSGTFPLLEERKMTVIDALGEAGGTVPQANPGRGVLIRKSSGKMEKIPLDKIYAKGDFTKNIELQDGDTLYVPMKGEKFNFADILNPVWALSLLGFRFR